jgi:hypothetical protein
LFFRTTVVQVFPPIAGEGHSTLHSNRSEHRADYTLERGVWHATCKACGHRVSDVTRQRAAGAYREHIKEERAAGSVTHPLLVDLTDSVMEPARPRALLS